MSDLISTLHRQRTDGRPFFLVPGLGGHVLSAQVLTSRVPEPWKGHGVLYPSFIEAEPVCPTLQAVAGRVVKDIVETQPEGHVLLSGYSMGGLVCIEIARLLKAAGRSVGVVLIDVKLAEQAPFKPPYKRWPLTAYYVALDRMGKLPKKFGEGARPGPDQRLSHLPEEQASRLSKPFARSVEQGRVALDCYRLEPVGVPSAVIRSEEITLWDRLRDWPHDYGWEHYTDVQGVFFSKGDHLAMVRGPNVASIGENLSRALQAVWSALPDVEAKSASAADRISQSRHQADLRVPEGSE